MADDKQKSHSWWQTFPTILPGLAALITALTGLIVAFQPIQKQSVLPTPNSSSSSPTSAQIDRQSKSTSLTPPTEQTRFFCSSVKKGEISIPATLVESSTNKNPLTLIYWDPKNTYFGVDWSPEKRCKEVSNRLQIIYNRDALKYITSDKAQWISNYQVNIICSTKDNSQSTRCEQDDLLFTLEGNDDPNGVLSDIINLRKAPGRSIPLNRGEKTQGKRIFYDMRQLGLEKMPVPNISTTEKSAF